MAKKKRNEMMMKRNIAETFSMCNIDELSIADDEDLYNLYMKFDDMKKNLERRGQDPKKAEVELCYISRELDIRSSRKKAHQAFLASMGVENDNKKTN